MSEILRLYPPPTERVEAIYADLEFPLESPRRDPSIPYIYINMVSSLDGRVTVNGKAGGIGSQIDRETMRILRSKADAVMVGAGSLRAEKISLTSEERRSPEPLAVIVAGAGDLPLEENLLDAEKDRTIILVPDFTPRERSNILSSRGHIIASPANLSGHPDLTKAIKLLKRDFQVNTLLVEGGPSLNHSLISDDLADELFLTLSPKLIGGSPGETSTILHGSYLSSKEERNTLNSVYISGDEVFLRYSLG
ncbi:MAG: RibD family protein [Rubrobacteraceae bacterium]|nr:RibD family protein [Rubrobacter sp.]